MPASRTLILLLSLGATIGCLGCHRRSDTDIPPKAQGRGVTVYATWYNVPPESLARRRAGIAELTAASDRLKPNTLVKVTRLSNGKSVTVRITDHGLHASKSRIDLCREAAEKLDMVSDGVAKVELEVLDNRAVAISERQPN